MRLAVRVLAMCALAACQQSLEATKSAGSAPECVVDHDCVAVAATCCDCPTFAVASSPTHNACAGVMCPVNACPNNVEAVCHTGTCTLVCAQLSCPTNCAAGFAMDADGCLSCACAVPAPDGCHGDGDCVRVRADCCGCAHGGSDTAVLASTASTYDAALECPVSPACPSVNTCDPAEAPHCRAGSCELSVPTAIPPGACGRPDLPACPTGTTCVINGNELADVQGVGVCTPP